ncbi:MAG: lysophospholipid acyltransferase family protein [Pseudorhodobacter sp.]|nr:lysophospholipid acyltransferase family protein [Pseudorhodobacter sp.]
MPKTSSRFFLPLAYAQNLVVSGLIASLKLLPYGPRVGFMGWMMRTVIGPVAGYRTRVRDNLYLIWPDLPQSQVAKLTNDVLDNVGRTLAELYSPQEFKANVAGSALLGVGLDQVLEAQAQGRGVILVSGHFGNHDIARAVLASRGMAVGALYRPQRNPYFDKHFAATIRAISKPLFARGRRGLAELVQHLRKGGMLGMLLDQHMRNGAPLTFLGHRALTALSAADMALKYNCLLVPVYGIRQKDGLHFDLLIEAAIPHTTSAEMTQALNNSLEAQVRAHPGQWFWVHRRWK